MYRIGYLSAPSRKSVEKALDAFLHALRDLGWAEGRNLVIEYRWADGKIELLPGFAAELVRHKVDLIVAPAASAARAAKDASSSIPIVMMFPNDPVAAGLVSSLRSPGGNVTGTTFTPGPEIYGKQVQLLRESVPHASRMAILWNPADAATPLQLREVEGAARSLGMRLQIAQARGPEEFDAAFAAMTRERAEALVVANSATFLVNAAPPCRTRAERPPVDDVQLSGKRRGGRPDGLRDQHVRFHRARRGVRRQDSQGRQACRTGRGEANEVRIHDQSENREDTGNHDPAVGAGARGRCD